MRRVELPPAAGVIAVLIFLGLGGGLLYIGANTWAGIDQARHAARTPGVVTNISCARVRSHQCSGAFTSDDGRVRLGHVDLRGIGYEAREVHGVLIRRIDTHDVLTIQDDDTVYVHGDVNLTKDYVGFGVFTGIGVLLAGVGLILVGGIARHMLRDLLGRPNP